MAIGAEVLGGADNRALDFGRNGGGRCRCATGVGTRGFTLCHAEFANLRRDGYVSDPAPASDELDLENTTRIEFEFRLRRDAEGDAPVPVQFAVELASISFF